MTDLKEETEKLLSAATPGEWHWDPDGSIESETGGGIATMFPFADQRQIISNEGRAYSHANAALIAAAPRLLRAWLAQNKRVENALRSYIEAHQIALMRAEAAEAELGFRRGKGES